MREILFRGKRIDNGEWVEGDLNRCIVVGESHICRIEGNLSTTIHKVAQETVCQYTGLIDRNGRKIFEGDIVTIPFSKRQGLPAEVHYSLVDAGFYIRRCGYTGISLEDSRQWCEVIGNVFDNLGQEQRIESSCSASDGFVMEDSKK